MATKRNFDEQRFDQDGELISTGSANAYVVRGARAVRNNFKGLRIKFRANFTNTGAATLQYGDAPAASIVKGVSTALVANDILSGGYPECIFSDATGFWQLQNPQIIDAATLGGFGLTASGDRWGVIAPVAADGGMEIGRYLDFHNSDADATDNGGRLRSDDIGSAGQDLSWLPTAGADSGITKRLITARNSTLAQGDILYYDGSNFVRLAPGTSGNFLQTLGAGANPQWAAAGGGITTIASGSLPAATTLDITNIPATFASLILAIVGASSNTATREVRVQVSTNNGSSFDTTVANYSHIKNVIDYAGSTDTETVVAGVASLIDSASQAAADTSTHYIYITGYNGGPRMKWDSHSVFSGTTTTFFETRGKYLGSTSAINALRILQNTTPGNFDAGTYALYGLS